MVAAQSAHHRTPSRPRAHDRPAHGVPNVHKTQRSRRIRADAVHRRACRPQSREIVSYSAALLHREGGFLEALEYAGHVVRNGAHDEAIKERHVAAGSCARENASCRQEAEIGQGAVEALTPQGGICLRCGQRVRHTPPGRFDVLFGRQGYRVGIAVFHLPDLPREVAHLRHLVSPLFHGIWRGRRSRRLGSLEWSAGAVNRPQVSRLAAWEGDTLNALLLRSSSWRSRYFPRAGRRIRGGGGRVRSVAGIQPRCDPDI